MADVDQEQIMDEEDLTISCCNGLPVVSDLAKPVRVGGDFRRDAYERSPFSIWPIFGPLIFVNEASESRDLCATERTFLSYLKLSVYMAIVSVAIAMPFHLQSKPTELELRMAKPLGAVFWVLSLACLLVGCANYINAVTGYSRKAAIVQTGWKTQLTIAVIAVSIGGACITFLVVNRLGSSVG